ncbi:hypothetical protein GCM10022234_05040 [Aeromicrobium panaciterrae]|uniref:ABC transporter substrate-binding protein n=1 Tax=Aeromicrobium panaciterrae TaxID=363861 RepID=UPI0031D9E59A
MNRRWLVTAICTIAIAASACSSDSDGKGNAETGVEDFKEFYTLTTFGPFSTAGAQGADDYDQIRVGALAAAKKINAAGGVNGKGIKIEACDTRGDSNKAVSCAKEAVKTSVATVGTFEGAGEYLPILEEGKIPAIGAVALASEYGSTAAYPVYNGLEIYLGLFALMQQQGIDDVAFPFQNDTAGSEAGLAPIVTAGEALGLTIETIPVEPDQTDYSPVVARAAKHDAIIIGLVDKQGVPFVQALRQTDYDGAVGGSLSAEGIDTLGDLANDLYSVNAYLPASYTKNAAVKEYVELMDSIDDKTLLDDAAANAYNSVLIFAEVAKGLDEVTGETLAKALVAKPIDTGLRPPVNFATPPASAKKSFPDLARMFDVNVVFEQVKDGVLTPISSNFYDAITAEEVPFG